jgi:hypothetical protein
VCLRKVDRGGGNHRCGHEICGQCRIKTIQERERAKKLQESILVAGLWAGGNIWGIRFGRCGLGLGLLILSA